MTPLAALISNDGNSEPRSPTRADVWVVGGGRFGRRAVEIMAHQTAPAKILVVDPNPEALAEPAELGVQAVQGDGTAFLVKNLRPESAPKWVIPCVPFHLAFKWIVLKLGRRARPVPVPPEYIKSAPNPLPAPDHGFFISHADFTCPDDCPEPAGRCTHTGLPRQGSLFAEAAQWPAPGFGLEVVRSRQLAPGLGGLAALDLLALENHLRTPGDYLVVTACRCHGVVHAVTISN
ncbi:MAG: NAD-binding protein [Pseudomonadota bacterium]